MIRGKYEVYSGRPQKTDDIISKSHWWLHSCPQAGGEEENPVQFIDAFVDNLDLEGLGFKHTKLKSTGRPPYNPADLLKLYIYGYLNRIRSSRCLEKECKRNIELMWLLKKLAPDFKTIADFRKDNKEAIKKVCLSADRQGGETQVLSCSPRGTGHIFSVDF